MQMNNTPLPASPVPSELIKNDAWNTAAVRDLINRKTRAANRPAFLFLGRREAQFLREHLGAAFGPESVRSLKNLYYMGLEVIELKTETFFRTAGMKRIQEFRDQAGRTPKWKDVSQGAFWNFKI